MDCGCERGYECRNNTCISLDECFSHRDCDDSDTCTSDVCGGRPKVCLNLVNKTCEEKSGDKLKGEKPATKRSNGTPSSNLIANKNQAEPLNPDRGEKEQNPLEAQIQEPMPKRKIRFGEILNWLKALFGRI